MEENLTSQELIEKREREKTMVSDMIRVYCKGNHAAYDKKTGVSAKSVRHWMIMRECAVTSALFMETKTFVPTARCIATSPRCASASKK